MRALVTGGAGYIGSVISELLVERGHRVVVFDDLSKGHADAVPAQARFVIGDVHDRERLEGVLREERIDAVVHMAAASQVGESVQNPAKYYANNVGGGLALLDALRAAGVKALVFSSTAAVYGEPARQPIEEGDPTVPTNPYGSTKLAFEQALAWYGAAYGLSSISLRYFNAAGASETRGERHDPETHLIPVVLDVAAGRLSELVIAGGDYPTPDGTCIRDYVHVLDLAEAHALALEAVVRGPRTARVYNLGCGGSGYSVHQVVRAAREATGRSIPTRIGPRRAGDPAVLVASSARIREELGWQPRRQDLVRIVASAWRLACR